MGVQLVIDTRNELAAHLKGDNIEEIETGYEHLTRLESRLSKGCLKLAGTIDSLFGAVDPKTEEATNIPDQGLKLLHMLSALCGEHGFESEVLDLLDAETERVEWSLTQTLSPSAFVEAARVTEDRNSLPNHLLDPVERDCIDLYALGYDCGLSYIPTGITIGQARQLITLYLRDV